MNVITRSEYPADGLACLQQSEQTHFWFRIRRRLLTRILAEVAQDVPEKALVLEAGCGIGSMLGALQGVRRNWFVGAMDNLEPALLIARANHPGVKLICGDIKAPPFGDRFHVVCALDVIEHIDDDVAALTNLRSMICAGGRLLLTVPAGPRLWSDFDEASFHRRRYTRGTLVRALESADFEVEHCAYIMGLLYPIMRLKRRRRTLLDGSNRMEVVSENLKIVPFVNNVMYFALGLESLLWERRKQLPFGTSLLAVARNPG